jgi:hypothetical protein
MARGREEPRLAARSVVVRQSDVYTAHTAVCFSHYTNVKLKGKPR